LIETLAAKESAAPSAAPAELAFVRCHHFLPVPAEKHLFATPLDRQAMFCGRLASARLGEQPRRHRHPETPFAPRALLADAPASDNTVPTGHFESALRVSGFSAKRHVVVDVEEIKPAMDVLAMGHLGTRGEPAEKFAALVVGGNSPFLERAPLGDFPIAALVGTTITLLA
jgi:hypothetical protein